jgi:hypothetical protein
MQAPRVACSRPRDHQLFNSNRDFTFERKEIASKIFSKKEVARGIVLYLTISLYETQRSIEAGPLALRKRAVWSTE